MGGEHDRKSPVCEFYSPLKAALFPDCSWFKGFTEASWGSDASLVVGVHISQKVGIYQPWPEECRN